MGAYKYDHPPLLAPGRHMLTLPDIDSLCVMPFRTSRVRSRLYSQLFIFIRHFQVAGIPCHILIDGSFLTEKIDPGDVDVAVLLDPDVAENLTDAQEKLVSDANDDSNCLVDDVDSFVDVQFPLGHLSYRLDGNEMWWSEQFAREHHGGWLKGVAVLRLGETDVGLRICR